MSAATKKQVANRAPETKSLGSTLDRYERYLEGQITYEQLHGLDRPKVEGSGRPQSSPPRNKR